MLQTLINDKIEKDKATSKTKDRPFLLIQANGTMVKTRKSENLKVHGQTKGLKHILEKLSEDDNTDGSSSSSSSIESSTSKEEESSCDDAKTKTAKGRVNVRKFEKLVF